MHPILARGLSLLTPIAVAASVPIGALTSIAEPASSPLLSNATAPTATNSGPRITFAQQLYDFGKVDSGTMVKHEYIFTNIGNQTLEVSNVQPGCGCTTAGSWDKKVEPGKTGLIPIQFNSSGYGGAVLKTITVFCNDPGQTNVVLQLKGTIWKAIDVSPSFAMFNVYPDTETNETKVIRIVSNMEEPLTLSEPNWSNSVFQVELKPVKEGKEFQLLVTLVPPLTNTVNAAITLKTSSEKMPVLTVTAYAMVVPAIAVTPGQITLPAGPLPSEIKPTVTIRNNSTNSLALSDPSINSQAASLQLKEVQPGRVFTLGLNFPTGFQIQPGQRVEAELKTTNPKVPLIKVPVYQLPAPAASPPAAAPASEPKAGSSSATTTLPSRSVASTGDSASSRPTLAPAPK
jgi:hypothetical protein